MTANRGARSALARAALCALLAAGCVPSAPPSGAWRGRARMTVARDEFGAAVVDGRIYAFGGMTGERGNDLRAAEVYDPRGDDWETLPRLPRPRSALRAAAVGERIYLVGGATGDRATATVESFDTRTRTYAP